MGLSGGLGRSHKLHSGGWSVLAHDSSWGFSRPIRHVAGMGPGADGRSRKLHSGARRRTVRGWCRLGSAHLRAGVGQREVGTDLFRQARISVLRRRPGTVGCEASSCLRATWVGCPLHCYAAPGFNTRGTCWSPASELHGFTVYRCRYDVARHSRRWRKDLSLDAKKGL